MSRQCKLQWLNGIQAMGAVTDPRRQLALTLAPAKPSYVLLAVEDTGSRLDRAIAHRTFEPFFSTKSEGLACDFRSSGDRSSRRMADDYRRPGPRRMAPLSASGIPIVVEI